MFLWHLFLCPFLIQAPNNVITYSLSGDDAILETFFISPTTGELTLQRSVLDDEASQFRVRIFFCVLK